MVISITGIVINVIVLILIIGLIITGIMFNNVLHECETEQSTFCYTIQCPCDSPQQNNPPCFGYAKRPGKKEGQWYCSNAPLTAVDNNGNII